MDHDLLLKRKYTFRSGDRKIVMVKKPIESHRHVVMKALLWALYGGDYPDLQVEVAIGNKYKPDLVQLKSGEPIFWGEAGRVRSEKLRRILKRFSHTHFALAVWGADLATLANRVHRATTGIQRRAPVDLIRFPTDADRRFIERHGRIAVRDGDLDRRRLTGP